MSVIRLPKEPPEPPLTQSSRKGAGEIKIVLPADYAGTWPADGKWERAGFWKRLLAGPSVSSVSGKFYPAGRPSKTFMVDGGSATIGEWSGPALTNLEGTDNAVSFAASQPGSFDFSGSLARP